MNHLQQSQQTIRVAKYIQHGFKTCIISQYTQLSAKYIRTLMKELTGKPASSGQLIRVPRLFKSRCATVCSLLLISLYHKVSPLTDNPNHVDLEILIKVYDHFDQQISPQQNEDKSIISINDAWVLIDAYLHHAIKLNPCKCGMVSVSSEDYGLEQSCPFCAVNDSLHFNVNGLKSVSVS